MPVLTGKACTSVFHSLSVVQLEDLSLDDIMRSAWDLLLLATVRLSPSSVVHSGLQMPAEMPQIIGIICALQRKIFPSNHRKATLLIEVLITKGHLHSLIFQIKLYLPHSSRWYLRHSITHEGKAL